MSSEPIDIIHQSLQRCSRTPGFLDLFYETFFNASPDVPRHFAHTDMRRQKRLVEASLHMSILAAEGVPYATAAIERLGEMHRDLHIQPALFDVWLDSLIQAVAACDDAFDAQVERAWRQVLRRSITMMLATYDAEA